MLYQRGNRFREGPSEHDGDGGAHAMAYEAGAPIHTQLLHRLTRVVHIVLQKIMIAATQTTTSK